MSRVSIYDPSLAPTDLRCPYCGGEGGFTHRYIQAYTSYILWNGYVDDTSEASIIKEYQRKYCVDCGKNVTKFIDEHLEELGFKA